MSGATTHATPDRLTPLRERMAKANLDAFLIGAPVSCHSERRPHSWPEPPAPRRNPESGAGGGSGGSQAETA